MLEKKNFFNSKFPNPKPGPSAVSLRNQPTSNSNSATVLSVKIDTPHDFWSNSKFHLSQLQGWSLNCQSERSTDLKFEFSDSTSVKIVIL